MPSSYPSVLDSLSTSLDNSTSMNGVHPQHHNDLADAVNKIEAELGTDPSGAAATVASRFATLPPGLPADTVVAAATRIIANLTTAGDAQPAWRVLGSGEMNWGAGGSTATDVTLRRGAANYLFLGTSVQRGALRAFGSAANDIVYDSKVTTDNLARWLISANGAMQWGDGTNPQDTTLSRGFAGCLYVGTSTQKGRVRCWGGISSDNAFEATAGGDTQTRFFIRADGQQQWGDGTAAQDTTLARIGVGVAALGTTAQKASLRIYGGAATDITYTNYVTNDANARFYSRADGLMAWGPGNATQDTTLSRLAPGELALGTTAQATALRFYGVATNSVALQNRITTDAAARFVLRSNGDSQWGDGTNSYDIVLSRAAAGSLMVQAPTAFSGAGTLTSGSPTVTGISSTTGILAGMYVSGTGITQGTTVLTVDSATQITLSANATANGAQTLTIGRETTFIVKGTAPQAVAPSFRVQTSTGTDQVIVTSGGTLALASNIRIGNTNADLAGGAGVVAIRNATTVPSTNPTAGGVLYVEAGALKYRGSAGTVTQIAAP